jgi:hypothetical protein
MSDVKVLTDVSTVKPPSAASLTAVKVLPAASVPLTLALMVVSFKTDKTALGMPML